MVWILKDLIIELVKHMVLCTGNSMADKITIVLDCGATNVRAVAVNSNGEIIAIQSHPNSTQPDPLYSGGIIWDIDEIWKKLCLCSQLVAKQVNVKDIIAITVTGFGVNGAPVDKEGKLLYPVISWQCQRTVPLMKQSEAIIPFEKLYETSGVYKFSFNTIYSLLWLKVNQPDILETMEGFLFITSLFILKLTGNFLNDTTMAGTSGLTDIKTRSFSESILAATGIPNKFFETKESGTIAGTLLTDPAKEMGFLD